MQPYLTVDSFLRHAETYMPHLAASLSSLSPEKVAQALTAKSCCEEHSYEKLEWLGDAVLKMVQTDSLLYSTDFSEWIHFLHEGDLSTLRSVMGCNDRLAAVCQDLKIDQFVITAPLGRGQWAPSSLELYTPSTAGLDDGEGAVEMESVSQKTFADVIESLLGLVYLTSGYDKATLAADELQVTLARNKELNAPMERQLSVSPGKLAAARALTGHKNFHRQDLVQEAFTHPTAVNPATPSYQRLEWIGDALLCLKAREWIYTTFPEMEVGQMVAIEASLVSNETLAYIAIRHGLLKHLDHCDQTLPGRIENYERRARELQRGLWSTNPPKTAADVVESVIGAVYMDSGFAFGMQAVGHILSPLFQVLEKLYAEDKNLMMMHPKKEMLEIAGSLLTVKVAREEDFATQQPTTCVWLGKEWGKASTEGQGMYVGFIECLGINVVSVLDSSCEVAQNRACALVVDMMKRYPDLLDRVQKGRYLLESSCGREEKQRNSEESPDETDYNISNQNNNPVAEIAQQESARSVTMNDLDPEERKGLLWEVDENLHGWI